MSRVLLVPGRSPAGPRHWMTLWAEAHPEYAWVRRRTEPDTDLPDRVAALDRAVNADPEPAVLVAHSLGCLTVATWAAQSLDDSPSPGPAMATPVPAGRTVAGAGVTGALLVTPPDAPERAEPFRRLPFPAIVVGSRNDEHMSFARAREYADGWGAEFVDAGDVGHLNSASGYGPWPAGEALLSRLRQ